jgi:hypothetical protein
MYNNVQENLSQSLLESNQNMKTQNEQSQTINLNGSYMFEDEEAMNSLLNKIGLAVQRQGGQNAN